MSETRRPEGGGRGRRFPTTSWSLVSSARDPHHPRSREALARLCEAYWPPLYGHVRRRGRSPDEALDLTQGFFASLLERGGVAGARQERGRFRSWLLGALDHYLANERARARAAKRGGGVADLPLDIDPNVAEGRYSRELADSLTPERVYERQWALTVLDRAATALREELEASGREATWRVLGPYLAGPGEGPTYREAATELATSEGAVKVAVHRLRRRYREILRTEVAATLANPGDVDDELRHLVAALDEPSA